jgi:hypothetical protein
MSYTGSLAEAALGSTIAINTGTTGSPTWTPIGEIASAPQSGRMAKTVETTNLQSTFAEFLPTIPESGTLDITANRVSSDAGQVALEAAFAGLLLKQFKITLRQTPAQTTTGDVMTFTALVEECNQLGEFSVDKQIVLKVKLKISGLVTLTVGS